LTSLQLRDLHWVARAVADNSPDRDLHLNLNSISSCLPEGCIQIQGPRGARNIQQDSPTVAQPHVVLVEVYEAAVSVKLEEGTLVEDDSGLHCP